MRYKVKIPISLQPARGAAASMNSPKLVAFSARAVASGIEASAARFLGTL